MRMGVDLAPRETRPCITLPFRPFHIKRDHHLSHVFTTNKIPLYRVLIEVLRPKRPAASLEFMKSARDFRYFRIGSLYETVSYLSIFVKFYFHDYSFFQNTKKTLLLSS